MKRANISQTRNGLSALLDRVRNGETILVTDRNRTIARIEPAAASGVGPDEGRLERLERAGLVRRATREPLVEILRVRPPALVRGADAVAALIEERRRGR